ncbi:hypothetical protein [Burkholderia multivorans]|uniref:hypothetical protein n=1 Tax=Burkholderia multivorans TaxID=87883 RepID=UPI0021C113E4|nr:hypothetical protein [Burkholderia multivorans]
MSKRDFGFILGQRVRIIPIDAEAMVEAVLDSFDGVQYRVCFWHDGARRVEWIYPSEIESIRHGSCAHEPGRGGNQC